MPQILRLVCVVLVYSSVASAVRIWPDDTGGNFPLPPRPVTIMPESEVSAILAKMPVMYDPWLASVIHSRDTMWYDKKSIVPGYQDSFGDNQEFPIGFRPNTIAPGLIAVPGGHAWLFRRSGEFNFPFGRTGHPNDALNTFVVDFWKLPRDGKDLLPVVWWKRHPSNFHTRYHWMFPVGTVFGELIFIKNGSSDSYIYEIRTRVRKADGWTVDVFRPFPTSDDFLNALENKRRERSSWQTSSAITNLVDYTRTLSSQVTETLQPYNFKSAFTSVQGGVDYLPAVDDPQILIDLLKETGFQSTKGKYWKQTGGVSSWAPSTKADFHIVPKNNSAAFFEVSDTFCNRCHQDAGRPIKDYYFDVQLYGEIWGEDEIFSWHPFDAKYFVDASGSVVNFGNENRKFRSDFVNAKVLQEYNPSVHPSSRYKQITQSWSNWVYR
ncbi:hypothetical protein K2X33_14235 [bacterium]|nr:hypothetical protein [bacterium]